MTALGFDPSKHAFGWGALGRTDGGPSYGVWSFAELDLGQLWDAALIKIAALITDIKPKIIGYERAHHRGGAATRQALGFVTVIELAAERAMVPYIGVASSTLKKWATGNGRAAKYEMVAAANEKFGLRLSDKDHDAADALLIAEYARRMDGAY